MSDVAIANLETLHRIFTVPESANTTLGAIDQAITADVGAFLRDHVVATEHRLEDIEAAFGNATVPESPMFVSDYTEFINQHLVANSVHTASPGFVGHMTTALPYFMLPLSRIMTALNQNLVKVETSKAFTPMERQVLAMLHHLVFEESNEFYSTWIHNPTGALGSMCSGGTIANITALWVARNRFFAPIGGSEGVADIGLPAAMGRMGVSNMAILVSRRGHYSLGKAADVLGIGRRNVVAIDTDRHHRIDIEALRRAHSDLQNRGIATIAVIGIAGTTETGSVDPLDELADFCGQIGCHFHVDAAWGGPTLFSSTHRSRLAGIERADSVTIDAHKQMYVPMGAGMVLFREPEALNAIEHHANYILRHGSKDLGSHTLEGSRPGIALLVHAGLSIIGRQGYEILVDLGIERARRYAEAVVAHRDFQLVTAPELNILTYRFVPAWAQTAMSAVSVDTALEANTLIDLMTVEIQKRQRESGHTFVSRTRLPVDPFGIEAAVFRVVLANPLTTDSIADDVLAEQQAIAASHDLLDLQSRLRTCLGATEGSSPH